jgi:AbiU2
MTADEVKADLIQKMGPEFGAYWHALREELVTLHAKRQQYRELYDTSDDRIALLNATAPFFFAALQDILWDDIVLHIARLVDDPGNDDKAVLTVLRIKRFVRDTPIARDVWKHIKTVVKASEFARNWRNKRVAHRNLKHVLGQSEQPLNAGSRDDVERALDAFRDLYNRIHAHYLRLHMDFELPGRRQSVPVICYISLRKVAMRKRHDSIEFDKASRCPATLVQDRRSEKFVGRCSPFHQPASTEVR